MALPALAMNVNTPSVFIHNGKAVTTSFGIAEYFQKTHDNVLKKIRSVIAECDDEYHVVNFNEMFQEVGIANNAIRKSPYYELTRDAFVLIAMGFTGKKALQWKINYINAFNRMEAELNTPSINSTANAIFIKFDIDGKVLFTEQVPHNAFVATIDGFIKLAKKSGYIVTTPEQLIKKLTH